MNQTDKTDKTNSKTGIDNSDRENNEHRGGKWQAFHQTFVPLYFSAWPLL